MRKPEHMPGPRHDDFLRAFYAIQQNPCSLFADQLVSFDVRHFPTAIG
jgi:hypothetical protein